MHNIYVRWIAYKYFNEEGDTNGSFITTKNDNPPGKRPKLEYPGPIDAQTQISLPRIL